ncbi:hypothetical protein B0H17DRAFT_1106285 [Mycena rosella]|uniref:Wax synthase domain-containing protein n=1 Tax=Mycena rosella TaxID=1033263 RepID=A0AAD7C3C5_MYCRO|nr:hypothetical protein B0H17DRAFT_1106285 [Mycena rosella]
MLPGNQCPARILFLLLATMSSNFDQLVLAQAPVNDVVSWPSGILLLASVLYAALGTSPDRLWDIEPAAGIFLFSGLPLLSIPAMQRVNWVANACHFISGIRNAYGKYNFWMRANDIGQSVRDDALKKATRARPEELPMHVLRWAVSSSGLIFPTSRTLSSPPMPEPQPLASKSPHPTARDFLLFAAIDYHVFRDTTVEVYSGNSMVFSTAGMPASAVVDVESEQQAMPVVIAHMVRRPKSQSPLAQGTTPTTVKLEDLDFDAPACFIDFHSYAPESSKVSASLRELAHAYYIVVQHINRTAFDLPNYIPGRIARISVGQTLWIAILGGAVLDHGRLTIQNLPGRRSPSDPSTAYIERVDAVLKIIEPLANTPAFFDQIYSNGTSSHAARPFLLAGLFGQAIICYFLSVGTSAGIFSSVLLANSLFSGRLNDWHSLYWGKTGQTLEPGMKMYVPGSKDLMCIATFDRSSPREGDLRQGFLLNIVGLIGAICGAVFEAQTREALNFGPLTPTRPWVVYTSITLCSGTSLLIAVTIILQQIKAKNWFDGDEMPTRWMVYSTIPASFAVSALGLYFQITEQHRFWPILDAMAWVSGLPLGMIENGRLIAGDDNMLHLILLNRWMMGTVASSIGSAQPR